MLTPHNFIDAGKRHKTLGHKGVVIITASSGLVFCIAASFPFACFLNYEEKSYVNIKDVNC